VSLPEGLLVNLGSGERTGARWINVDGSWQAWLAGRPPLARLASWVTGRPVGTWPRTMLCRDVRRRLPFRTESVAAVFSSHLVEHLRYDDARRLMDEARRVLVSGGVCRVIVPDLADMVRAYLEDAARPAAGKAEPSGNALMDRMALGRRGERPAPMALRWYRRLTDFDSHKWMYDAESLLDLFRQSGFAEPRVRGPHDSAIPAALLAEVERPERLEKGAGVCVEALK
jgi:SAM-dependent methyltransferase